MLIFGIAAGVFALLCFASPNRNQEFLACVVGFGIIIFFNHYLFERHVETIFRAAFGIPARSRYVIFVELIVYLGALAIVHRFIRSRTLPIILIAGLGAFVLTDLALAGPTLIQTLDERKKLVNFIMPPRATQKPSASVNKKARDVYFILPDALTGPETTPEILGGYKLKLVEKLQYLGFRVVKHAVSNGLLTFVSVPHLMSMNYFLKDGQEITAEMTAKILASFSGYNAVVAGFRNRGYKYYQVQGTYHVPKCGGYQDVCIMKSHFFEPVDLVFLDRTVFPAVMSYIHATALRKFLPDEKFELPDLIDRLPNPSSGPFFLFAHFSIPHLPYRYRADCTKYPEPPYPYPEENKSYKKEFKRIAVLIRDQTICAEKQIEEVVKAIRLVLLSYSRTMETFRAPSRLVNSNTLVVKFGGHIVILQHFACPRNVRPICDRACLR